MIINYDIMMWIFEFLNPHAIHEGLKADSLHFSHCRMNQSGFV